MRSNSSQKLIECPSDQNCVFPGVYIFVDFQSFIVVVTREFVIKVVDASDFVCGIDRDQVGTRIRDRNMPMAGAWVASHG